MHKTSLTALMGLLITASSPFAMDIKFSNDPSAGHENTQIIEHNQPNGDTEPLNRTIVTTLKPKPQYYLDLPTEIHTLATGLSKTSKFLSINFVDDKGKFHPETKANALLRDKFSSLPQEKKFSALHVFNFVAQQAYKCGFGSYTSKDSIELLFNCGKALRHITSILPPELDTTVCKGNISDKFTLWNLDLLNTSAVLLKTALYFAEKADYTFLAEEIRFSLQQTENHRIETFVKIQERNKIEKEKEKKQEREKKKREIDKKNKSALKNEETRRKDEKINSENEQKERRRLAKAEEKKIQEEKRLESLRSKNTKKKKKPSYLDNFN